MVKNPYLRPKKAYAGFRPFLQNNTLKFYFNSYHFYHCVTRKSLVCHACLTQLSPDIFDPRKVDTNFLEANFEYFSLLTAMGDANNQNCPSSFLDFGLKGCQNLFYTCKNAPKMDEIAGNACFSWFQADFATFKTQFNNLLGQKLKKSLDSSIFLHPPWLLKL